MERPEAFDCAICGHHIDNRWPGPKSIWSLAPVCRYCEDTFAPPMPPRGAFRDRRIARQIHALAEALETEARHQHYRRFGYAAP